MPEKTYKVRVELSLIVEINLDAVHEDEAAAISEEIVWGEAQVIIKRMARNYRIPNAACRCIEVNNYAESDE